MLLDAALDGCIAEIDICQDSSPRWGVSSETGRLTDVLLSAPAYLTMVPCNAVTRQNLAKGLSTTSYIAARQHRLFAAALSRAGVRCHFLPPAADLPDLSFTRDAVLMSPWGLIELRPAAAHRVPETRHVAAAASRFGAPLYARIEQGKVEGGDICLLRDGLVLIGYSGDRTDERGARLVGRLFTQRGWDVIYTRFDPRHLHLDTIMTMVADNCAVVCPEALESGLLEQLQSFGLTLVTASMAEVESLGANLLSLGNRRLIIPSENARLCGLLRARGIEAIEVEIDQFTRCGGGPHCMTLPLARFPA
jgi:N-dimethylarginine dimethylaminohydrolase